MLFAAALVPGAGKTGAVWVQLQRFLLAECHVNILGCLRRLRRASGEEEAARIRKQMGGGLEIWEELLRESRKVLVGIQFAHQLAPLDLAAFENIERMGPCFPGAPSLHTVEPWCPRHGYIALIYGSARKEWALRPD